MNRLRKIISYFLAAAFGSALLLPLPPAVAYVEVPYPAGKMVAESTNILLMRVEKVDKERNLIIYSKVRDIKGSWPHNTIKHVIGQAGFHPREWQNVMAAAEIGKMCLFLHNGAASETCMDNYWYQAYPNGEWWAMSHAEPFLLRTFAGKPEKFATLIEAMLAGKEVVLPCMVDGDKDALHARTAKIHRLRASLNIQDYDAKRDFAGFGGDEFRALAGMARFAQLGTIGRMEPGPIGIASADVDGDGRSDLCLWSEDRVSLLKSAGNAMEDLSLPHAGGARGATFADHNADGKLDLLLATPIGPKLFTNTGAGRFKDDSALLPKEHYYNLTAAAMADFDNDGKQDILLANGFLGLRLYRNIGAKFEDASHQFKLGQNGIGGKVKGDRLLVADVNGDGRTDFLYCAGKGLLALNTPAGFVESTDSGLAFECGKITPAFGDFNADKSPDLFVPQPAGSKLYKNDGKGHFIDVTAQSGDLASLGGGVTSALFVDFDKSGKLDLLIGRLKAQNRLLRNKGDGTFADATENIGLHQKVFGSRALITGDFNKDGILDLAVLNEGKEESAVLIGKASPQSKSK